jgi:hypothetical protein
MPLTTYRQEALMGKAIPAQHPAVVLRTHYKLVRALLAVAMVALVALTTAVVILATDDDHATSIGSATQPATQAPAAGVRYDGGPDEGTRGIVTARQAGVRYDGGPEEGTAALTSIEHRPGMRYDGGPEEGSRGSGH